MIKFIITVDKKFHSSFDTLIEAKEHLILVEENEILKEVRLHIIWISAYEKYMEDGKQYEFLLRNELYG